MMTSRGRCRRDPSCLPRCGIPGRSRARRAPHRPHRVRRPPWRSAQPSGSCPDPRGLVPLAKFAGPLLWKISNIRSSRIVLNSRSVYLIEMITLRQLRYLSALAKHGHFGRAAEACAVTQPALSMQIRDLERTLGVAVVERRPGDVMLTDVGREIARRADDVLTASRDLVDF